MGGMRSRAFGRLRPTTRHIPVLPAALALLLGCSTDGPDGRGGTRGEPQCEPEPGRPPGIVAAGSGSDLALVRAIARRYAERRAGARISIPDSIGTGGAIRALVDGAIDLGLASRALTDAERRLGLVETPLARTILAVAAHAGTPVTSLTRGELVELYAGRRTVWSDGTPIVPLLREAGDSGEQVLSAAFPELGAAFEAARRAERWIVCYTDQELRDALLGLEGAIGLLDVGTIRLDGLDLVTVAIDGVAPTPANVHAGRYRLLKPLSLITRGPPAGRTAEFVEFARSPETAEILATGLYLPADGDGD